MSFTDQEELQSAEHSRDLETMFLLFLIDNENYKTLDDFVDNFALIDESRMQQLIDDKLIVNNDGYKLTEFGIFTLGPMSKTWKSRHEQSA